MFPTFNSLVVLNSFHPFPMLILGDPLIFLPLVKHAFVCLTSCVFIALSFPCQSCHYASLGIYRATRPAKDKKWFRVDQCGIFKLVLV